MAPIRTTVWRYRILTRTICIFSLSHIHIHKISFLIARLPYIRVGKREKRNVNLRSVLLIEASLYNMLLTESELMWYIIVVYIYNIDNTRPCFDSWQDSHILPHINKQMSYSSGLLPVPNTLIFTHLFLIFNDTEPA